MKAFVVLLAVVVGAAVAFPQDAVVAGEEPDVLVRAPSTYQNCDCQCDSYSWTSNGKILGNCLSADATGANFCYVSGRAAQACRDVQISQTRKDSFSDRGKFFSYEACATPPRNLCRNGSPLAPGQNIGDGDFVAGGHSSGGRPPVNGPGGLGAILGIRTAGGAEEGVADAVEAAAGVDA